MADLANLSWATTAKTNPHLLSVLVDTPMDPEDNSYTGIISSNLYASITARLPPSITVDLLSYSNVYVNNLIALVKGGPSDQRMVCNHVSHAIDKVFRPNAPVKSKLQEPNVLKKLKKEDGTWKPRKRVLGACGTCWCCQNVFRCGRRLHA